MPDPYMQYQPDDTDGPTFRWHGGAYIDVGYEATVGDFRADDVINVWNSAADTPLIPVTLAAFAARCDEWIEDTAAQ